MNYNLSMNYSGKEYKPRNLTGIESKDLRKKKEAARQSVRYHLKCGHIQKAEFCEISWCEAETENLEAHHPDYDKPLDVIWCCRNCHWDLHREINSLWEHPLSRKYGVV